MSALLFGLVIAVFLTFELAVVVYAGPVGWVDVTFTIIFALLGFGTIVWRSPLEWPSWLVALEREEHEAFEKHFWRGAYQGGRREDDSDLVRAPSRRQSQQHQTKREDAGSDYDTVALPAVALLVVIGAIMERLT